MNRFENKTVVVTGAANGLGAESVRRLHSEGACVVAVDLQASAIEEALGSLVGPRVLPFEADVTDRERMSAAVTAASERFGNLHGLVHCAGVRGNGAAQDIDEETWDRVMNVNTTGTYRACQVFVRELIRLGRKGAIVNFSSSAGVMGVGGRLGYVASKWAVSGMTRAMAIDLGPEGIRVNALAPGIVRTALTSYILDNPESAKRIADAHPIGHFGEAADIAAAVAFLLSDEARYITGVVLSIDGGMAAGLPSLGQPPKPAQDAAGMTA